MTTLSLLGFSVDGDRGRLSFFLISPCGWVCNTYGGFRRVFIKSRQNEKKNKQSKQKNNFEEALSMSSYRSKGLMYLMNCAINDVVAWFAV
jgi:hypothetical protein